jgi:hypothetical protein
MGQRAAPPRRLTILIACRSCGWLYCPFVPGRRMSLTVETSNRLKSE